MEVTEQRTNTARHTANWALWALQGLTALGFAGAAVQKLTGSVQVMRTFDDLGWGAPPRIMLALLELIGAVALVLPRLAGVAAAGFVALTSCAVCVQVGVGESVLPPAIMLVLAAVIAWCRRDSIIEPWHMLRRPATKELR